MISLFAHLVEIVEIPSFKYQSRKINQSIYSLGRRVLFLFHRQLFQCHHHHRNTKKNARVHKKFLKVHFGISTFNSSDSRQVKEMERTGNITAKK